MNIVQRIDIFFSKSINAVLRFFLHLFLLVMGGIYVAAFFVVIFEYDEALADLANIEIVILGLLGLLLYRHYRYCRYFQAGLWKTISSPYYALGVLATIYSVIWAVFIAALILTKPELKVASLLYESKLEELVLLICFLVAIYLSTPTKKIQAKTVKTDFNQGEEEPSTSPDLTSAKHADDLINKQY